MDATNLASSVHHKQTALTWQNFVDWLYVPNDFNRLTRALTGLSMLFVLPFVWLWSHGGPGPTTIPAWRLGSHLLVLPLPGEQISIALFCAAVVSALAMIIGAKHKIWPGVCAAVIGYYGSVDWVGCGLHFILLEWIMLVAFLFDRPDRSPTRRLIQVSTILCYFLSATQKLFFPDFVAGYSLESTFSDGAGLGWGWNGVLPVENFAHGFWLFFSWLTIAGEYFFAFGLSIPRSRRLTLMAAVAFHLGIAVFLGQFIAIFSLVMWSGLSTFLSASWFSKTAKGAPELPVPSATAVHFSPITSWVKIQSAVAAMVMLVLLLFPLRVYFFAGRPVDKLSFFDRSPWSYCMYLARQETTRLVAKYLDPSGNWHEQSIDKTRDRWGRISSDNETYALADYIFKVHPDAQRVRIESDILLNGHLPQEKILERDRNDINAEVRIHFSSPLTSINVQKHTAGPGAADF